MNLQELAFDGEVGLRDKGPAVKRVQEWLNLQGYGLAIDADFGRVSEDAVRRFQKARRLKVTGRVNKSTFTRLVRPMSDALRKLPRKPASLSAAIVACAKAHLAGQPREIGAANGGPWVRLYMNGMEGQPWCAGFVSFILAQAAAAAGKPMPIAGSVSCDQLAAQGKAAGSFAAQPQVGSVFLVRGKVPGDWVHTGFVTGIQPDFFYTLEGNTNDTGDREGYEVCARTRGYAGKDFVVL